MRLGTDVEQQIARRRRGVVARAVAARRTGAARRGAVRRTTGPRRRSRSTVTIDRCLDGSRKPTARTSPAEVRQRVVHRRLRRPRRWWPPGRWPPVSAAPVPVAVVVRAPFDPSVKMTVGDDGEHVHGQCARAVRVHRRVAVAVPRLRRRSRSGCAPPATPNWPRPTRGPTAGRRFFTVRAGSLVAWRPATARSRPAVPRSSAATPTAPTCGSSSTPTGSWPAGRWSRCEPYGGAWLNSWLDRDLGISGRLSVRDPDADGGVDAPAGPHRRADPAGAATGDPPRRGPQAAVKLDPQRHVNAVWGARRHAAVVPGLRRRAGRGGRRRRAAAST